MHRPAKQKSDQIISSNRFETFFESVRYIALKNYLYNYLLRKRAVEKALGSANKMMILEVGSGISPMVTINDRVVYTDLSFAAVKMLRNIRQKGWYVVADAVNLPFKRMSFSHVIASEVLEHLSDDHKALEEMAAVLVERLGQLIVTFPHRRFYFACDDTYVGHYRRYELDELSNALQKFGLSTVSVKKVLGPLEKVTMMTTVGCIRMARMSEYKKFVSVDRSRWLEMLVPFFRCFNRLYAILVWLDARIIPRSLASVLLIKAEKARDGFPVSSIASESM